MLRILTRLCRDFGKQSLEIGILIQAGYHHLLASRILALNLCEPKRSMLRVHSVNTCKGPSCIQGISRGRLLSFLYWLFLIIWWSTVGDTQTHEHSQTHQRHCDKVPTKVQGFMNFKQTKPNRTWQCSQCSNETHNVDGLRTCSSLKWK